MGTCVPLGLLIDAQKTPVSLASNGLAPGGDALTAGRKLRGSTQRAFMG